MTKQEAVIILRAHNKWRRGTGNAKTKKETITVALQFTIEYSSDAGRKLAIRMATECKTASVYNLDGRAHCKLAKRRGKVLTA